jgi:hypothetical protein
MLMERATSTETGSTVPGVDFNALRAEITMEQVLDLLGFEPSKRSGVQWYGSCPLHESASRRSRCFSVHVARGSLLLPWLSQPRQPA